MTLEVEIKTAQQFNITVKKLTPGHIYDSKSGVIYIAVNIPGTDIVATSVCGKWHIRSSWDDAECLREVNGKLIITPR